MSDAGFVEFVGSLHRKLTKKDQLEFDFMKDKIPEKKEEQKDK